MRTKVLNTGVRVTFNDKNEIVSVFSPYHNNEPPTKYSLLKYFKIRLKKILDN